MTPRLMRVERLPSVAQRSQWELPRSRPLSWLAGWPLEGGRNREEEAVDGEPGGPPPPPQDRLGGRLGQGQGQGLGGCRCPHESPRVPCHLGLSQTSPFYRRNSRLAKTPDNGRNRKDAFHLHCSLDVSLSPDSSGSSMLTSLVGLTSTESAVPAGEPCPFPPRSPCAYHPHPPPRAWMGPPSLPPRPLSHLPCVVVHSEPVSDYLLCWFFIFLLYSFHAFLYS